MRRCNTSGVVTTLAGSTFGYRDDTGAAAQFANPSGVEVDTAGNVYVADFTNNRIRKVSPSGVVTTLVGSGVYGYLDATGTAAQFANPSGVEVDTAGNVYVADFTNNRIRKVSPSGVVTTLAGSGVYGYLDATGTAAQFASPFDVALDTAGNVYVADLNNHRIRKVSAVVVDTTPPLITTPDLTAASDTGFKDDDNVTSNNTPTFQIETEEGAFVELIDVTDIDNVVVLTSVTAVEGSNDITLPEQSDGVYNVAARATDAAGNVAVSGAYWWG